MIGMFIRGAMLLALWASCAKSSASEAEEPASLLESTVKTYLSASAAYRPGDLIARSQIEEIQVYLRRTQGNSLATHIRWRSRFLQDRSRLVQIFNSGGESVLRSVAAQSGGYAGLDRLSRTGAGRKKIQQAIKDRSPEALLHIIAAEQAKRAVEQSKTEENKAVFQKTVRLYTATDFCRAVEGFQAPVSAKMPVEVVKEPLEKSLDKQPQ